MEDAQRLKLHGFDLLWICCTTYVAVHEVSSSQLVVEATYTDH